MSSKIIYLHTLAMNTMLAHTGCYVPAKWTSFSECPLNVH
jgi:DNA mismatch repair ATPase MutS